MCSCTTDSLVPSFYTFFEDLNYLKGPTDCVKRLMKLSPRDTVLSALEQTFSDVNQKADQCVIQESDGTYAFKPGDVADRLDSGIRQIWISAMRNYLEMPAGPKRKSMLAKPKSEKADQMVLCEFAALAYQLGFETEEIRSLMQRSPDREIARDALLKARKPGRYEYDNTAFEDHVGQIVRIFSTARLIAVEQPGAPLDTDDSGEPPKRYGLPCKQDYQQAKSSPFLGKLHEADKEACNEMTSLFVRRSVYLAFFW